MTEQHPMLPTQQQFTEWDSEYFDGEGQNFDVMMMKAFQAGADQRLDQVIKWLDENLHDYLHEYVCHEYRFAKDIIEDFKLAMNSSTEEDNND